VTDDQNVATAEDLRWLDYAIGLSRKCPPTQRAYNVGAIIVDAGGTEIANGYSRETDPHAHAEEAALAKLARNDPRLIGSTTYSSLEPCTQRHSRRTSCTELIIASGTRRVVIAWREPAVFVADCQGVERLRAAGITVVEIQQLERAAKAVNRHLFDAPADDANHPPRRR
jgi:pyrimidine deaminase RibD-like protein